MAPLLHMQLLAPHTSPSPNRLVFNRLLPQSKKGHHALTGHKQDRADLKNATLRAAYAPQYADTPQDWPRQTHPNCSSENSVNRTAYLPGKYQGDPRRSGTRYSQCRNVDTLRPLGPKNGFRLPNEPVGNITHISRRETLSVVLQISRWFSY